jgi:hypothetical protein
LYAISKDTLEDDITDARECMTAKFNKALISTEEKKWRSNAIERPPKMCKFSIKNRKYLAIATESTLNKKEMEQMMTKNQSYSKTSLGNIFGKRGAKQNQYDQNSLGSKMAGIKFEKSSSIPSTYSNSPSKSKCRVKPRVKLNKVKEENKDDDEIIPDVPPNPKIIHNN